MTNIDYSVTLPLAWSVLGETSKTITPRPRPRRGAMEWAIQFAFEHPGSMGAILGVTAVSLDMLLNGRDGLAYCMSDRVIDGECRRGRLGIHFSNGSQITGYPSTIRPDRFYGLNINYVLIEQGVANGRALEALTQQLRPLPGIENCIITITDDEADE